jgi:hypothetical protein
MEFEMTTTKNPRDSLADLHEALADHECASDAILGKHIDTLAKYARKYAALSQKPSGGDAVDRYIPEFEKLMNVNPDTRARNLAAKLIPRLKAALTPSPDYVMVPREPTQKMIDAGHSTQNYCNAYQIYRAMLDAAPEREG